MKVQEALKAAIEEFEILGATSSDAYAKCKSALSELEAREPVGYILTATLDKMKLAGTSHAHLHSCIGQKIKPPTEYTAFYTSPISKEREGWVSVPIEPTYQMCAKALVACPVFGLHINAIPNMYQAMISSLPNTESMK